MTGQRQRRIAGNAPLGAVLAGGLSSRFGSDKAEALLDGRRLIDHAIHALTAQCDRVIIVGRQEMGHDCTSDWPEPNRGPLGGIAGALIYAKQHGYDAVMTCGVDSPHLPANLAMLLTPGPSCLDAQPVIGLWPTHALSLLECILTGSYNHSVRHFADRIAARRIQMSSAPNNVNTREELSGIEQRNV